MAIFKKLSSGASNLFKKMDSGANNLFKKSTNALEQVGSGIANASNVVGKGLQQTGNILEKAAPIAADVGAGIAVVSGNPELAPQIMNYGKQGKQLGGQLKQAGSSVQTFGGLASGKTNSLTNVIRTAQQSLANSPPSPPTTGGVSAANNLAVLAAQ